MRTYTVFNLCTSRYVKMNEDWNDERGSVLAQLNVPIKKKKRKGKKVKNNSILPRLFLKPRNFGLFLSFPENNLYDLNATRKLIGRLTVGSELIETPGN